MGILMRKCVVGAALLLSQACAASDVGAARPALRVRSVHAAAPLTAPPRGSGDLYAAAAPSAGEEQQWKGLLAMLGGIMIHLTCGSMYCWGNLISYLPPTLKYWAGSEGTGPADAQLVLPLILVAQMIGMPFGPLLEKQLGPRLTALVGALMMGSGVFLASYATKLANFVWLYSMLFGVGVGVRGVGLVVLVNHIPSIERALMAELCCTILWGL